jgi:hypothetical protein
MRRRLFARFRPAQGFAIQAIGSSAAACKVA